MRGRFSDRRGYSKPNVFILIVLAIVLGALAWWFLSGTSREGKIDRIVTADVDSSAVWQARVDSLLEQSRVRDSIAAEDSVVNEQVKLRSMALAQSLSETRSKLRNLTEARDSLAVYIRLDTLHQDRETADSVRILILQRQANVIRIDRDAWKRSTLALQKENARVTQDLIRVRDLGQQRCNLLFIHLPCPQVVVGPAAGVSSSAELQFSVVAVTVGIPLRLGHGKPKTARYATPVPPVSEAPVVSDLERQP